MLNFIKSIGFLYNRQDINFALFYNLGKPILMLSEVKNAVTDFNFKKNTYYYGYIAYDYKNSIENLTSDKFSGIDNSDCFFSEADRVMEYVNDEWQTVYDNKKIRLNRYSGRDNKNTAGNITLKQHINKNDYIAAVGQLQKHIIQGDIYEVNYCMEFYAENAEVNPFDIFEKLFSLAQAPYSVLLKHNDIYVLCASPERFLKKQGNKIVSQPIKGTAGRGKTIKEDYLLKEELFNNPKERAENVMIVDLVRNDLSRIAKTNSVKVDELFGIYTFKTVHQMVSTVSCNIKENISFKELIHATFPMGSMTGAPKIKAMELIEKYEKTKRGIYSGSIGYILPNNDFDFNVVIRSILYNKKNKYLSFSVGSAITTYADAEKEYKECLLKAQAMKQALAVND